MKHALLQMEHTALMETKRILTNLKIEMGNLLKLSLDGDKLHAKKRKREIRGKKGVNAKRSAKITERVENKRTSSKINYNALQKLTDELKQVPAEAELGGREPKVCANGDSAENLNIGFHELEQENEYGEDDDSFRDNDHYDSYYGYGT
ncbi:hypothetical protein HAX54_005380 [Datura stramonium]|uniref:Brf1 TBP-binding domain-containing protein n=1 Tax=Datura stramonium TaxID=4076 RepID=A0ABS8TA88_DATST|nr:hypothetical protein [Datura stramonium]